ncbi:MAG: hypothetical protein MJZ53_04060 [Paludibacteraceae bacterium]|nr:hypothetical protein [Paludibacteraceae bacterium]
MADISTCLCRKCGAKIPFTGDAVSKHYEKFHFSEWTVNKDLMKRMPKAFVVDNSKDVRTPENVRKAVAKEAEDNKPIVPDDTPEITQKREANKDNIMARLTKCADKLPYKPKEPFICECCGKATNVGMNITCSRERFTLCYACYNATRLAIPHKTREMK